jgi:hypothetical protein
MFRVRWHLFATPVQETAKRASPYSGKTEAMQWLGPASASCFGGGSRLSLPITPDRPSLADLGSGLPSYVLPGPRRLLLGRAGNLV